jgi:hypothetical protein
VLLSRMQYVQSAWGEDLLDVQAFTGSRKQKREKSCVVAPVRPSMLKALLNLRSPEDAGMRRGVAAGPVR